MMRSNRRNTSAAVVIAVMAALGAGAARTHAASDTFATWNVIAVDAAVNGAKRTQTVSTIEVTIVQAAVYDAVNAIDGAHYQPYASLPPAPAWASADAAVATAAHDVLVWLYPGLKASLDAQLAATLAGLTAGPETDAGVAAGAAAASAVIALRTNDGRDAQVQWTAPEGPGGWVPTPPAYAAPQTPWVALMKPFTMSRPSQFRPGPPPALTGQDYAEAFQETATRGAKVGSTRTQDEMEQALFWSDNFTIQWNRYLRTLAAAEHLSTPDRARLFAQVNMAAADGLIACMDAKYAYGFWRPVTAIPAAGIDGNSATTPDPDWLPLLATPNHPEYPSAHSCGSGAIVATLAGFFGTDHVSSTMTSTVPGSGQPRTFARFKDIEQDLSESRILGGLHFRFSLNAGRVLAGKVSKHLVNNYFKRVD